VDQLLGNPHRLDLPWKHVVHVLGMSGQEGMKWVEVMNNDVRKKDKKEE
jgi:hypothetical protein